MRTRISAILAILATLGTMGTAQAQSGGSACSPPHVSAFVQLMEDYVAVFNSHDVTLMDTVLTPDYWTENPLGIFEGLETFQYLMAGVYAALPDIEYQIDNVVVYGNQIVLEYSYTATHLGEFLGIPGTGTVVHGRGMELHAIENGRIAATWNYSDIFGLLVQLGAF